MTEGDQRQEEKVYSHFKSLSKEELAKLLFLMDEDFTELKRIIQDKIDTF